MFDAWLSTVVVGFASLLTIVKIHVQWGLALQRVCVTPRIHVLCFAIVEAFCVVSLGPR